MKTLRTNLEGKINNLPGFKGEALLPVFEAVVNSIQAIEELGDLSKGDIRVQIHRDGQQTIFEDDARPIRGFEITDNGIGFTDANLDSFETSDSVYKLAKGGKGVGRFLWLKAFDRVEIESIYLDGVSSKKRGIVFTRGNGIEPTQAEVTTDTRKTTVKLIAFKEEYRKLPTAFKTTKKIAQRILEHCLSYFIGEGAPKITVVDDSETIVLNELFKAEVRGNMTTEVASLAGHDFEFTHLKLYSTHEHMHNIVLCANRRDVKSVNLSRALSTSTQFEDGGEKFTYALYVSSVFLDKHVDMYRLGFDIPEDAPLLGSEGVVSLAAIVSKATEAAKEFLQAYLVAARKRKEEVVSRHIAEESPALRSVPHYCPEIYDELESGSSPEKINEVLYRHKGKAEYEVRKRSDELLKTQSQSLDEISEAYERIAKKISDFQKDNLVNYLCDRKRIIALLDKKLELNSEGKYSKEEIVHDMVFPRKTTTHELSFENHNLWLVDECLTFHAFAASDKPLSQITYAVSEERPDVVSFAEVDDAQMARAVSILEFKKPQRKAFDEDPTKQVYRYLREIRGAKRAKLPTGRDLHISDTTRFYCFVLCDLTPAVREFAENGNYSPLQGELGFYAYNRALNAHTEILAFDKIVVDAKRRHKAFFDKLGI